MEQKARKSLPSWLLLQLRFCMELCHVLVVTDGELVVMETALVTVVIALVVTAGTATPSAHSPTVVANIRRNTLNAPPFIDVKLVGNRSFCERFL